MAKQARGVERHRRRHAAPMQAGGAPSSASCRWSIPLKPARLASCFIPRAQPQRLSGCNCKTA